MSRKRLTYPAGRLSMATDDTLYDRDARCKERLAEFGVYSMEILNSEKVRYRWPQLNTDGLDYGVYLGGDVTAIAFLASEACRALVSDFEVAGIWWWFRPCFRTRPIGW